MKKIAVLSTGGTIAMMADKSGLAVPAIGARELIASLPGISEQIDVRDISFKNIPGPQITHEDLVSLRNLVIDLKNQSYDGVVITHGTDTMEETAYFLDLTVNMEISIVLTGAQRNLSSTSSDVQLNLTDAILTAADDKTAEMGAVIVFASEIVPAREATKFHRSRVDTFKSLEFGPIGTINNNIVLWFRKSLMRDSYGLGDFRGTVDIIPSYVGSDSRMIQHSVDDGADGIVIQGLGGGHVPKKMITGIQNAIDTKIPVVLTSRVPTGRLFTNTYGYEGAEKQLRNMGVIFGGDLSPQKARIKLLVLLSLGFGYDDIKREFERRMYK